MKQLHDLLLQRDPVPFDCIVHIGAGGDAKMLDYAPLQAARLLLVEADPDAFTDLAVHHSASDCVVLVHALVSGHGESQTFQRYSLPMLNSPLDRGSLLEIYPRLELLDSIPMEATCLTTLLSAHASTLGNRNLLILDIPGQEAAVLNCFPQTELENFPWILVCGTCDALQLGGNSLEKTRDFLTNYFYEPHEQFDEDPTWPMQLFRLDPRKAEIHAELHKRELLLLAKDTEIQRQTDRIQELETQLADAFVKQDQLGSRLNDLTNQFAERDKQLHAEISTLVAERDAIATERDLLTTSLDESKNELKKSSQLLDEKHAVILNLSEKIKELEFQNATLNTEQSTLIAERQDIATERDLLTTSLDESKNELKKSSQLLDEKHAVILSLSERIKELESQYAKINTEQSELHSRFSSLIKERDFLVDRMKENQDQLHTERRIIEALAGSIKSNADSFRNLVIALNPGSEEESRPKQRKLQSAINSATQHAPTVLNNFNVLSDSESKAVGSFLKSLSDNK